MSGVVVEAGTIGMFKELLDKHMNMQIIEGYGLRAGRRDLIWRHVWHNIVGLFLSCTVLRSMFYVLFSTFYVLCSMFYSRFLARK